jgi:hypothetical protein
MSDRRGRAITAGFVVLLALFLLNYLAEFWQPLAKFQFLNPLHYHRPMMALETGVWPLKDMCTLLLAGALMWLAGGVIFARRDLCTV